MIELGILFSLLLIVAVLLAILFTLKGCLQEMTYFNDYNKYRKEREKRLV